MAMFNRYFAKIPEGKPPFSCGFAMVLLWLSRGFPMKTSVFPWCSHGFPMVFPWFSHGFPMVFPVKMDNLSISNQSGPLDHATGHCSHHFSAQAESWKPQTDSGKTPDLGDGTTDKARMICLICICI